MKSAILAAALALAMALPVQAQAAAQTASGPPLIPSNVFAQEPPLSGPILAPNGNKLITMIHRGGQKLVGVHDFATGNLEAISLPERAEIAFYRWAGNDKVLISAATTVPYFGEDARMTRLFLFDLATRKAQFVGKRDQGLEGDDILFVDPAGGWLLLSIQKTIYDWPSVYRVDLDTLKMREVVRQQDRVWEWYADRDGVVRAGLGFLEKSSFMVYRRNETEPFKRTHKTRYEAESSQDVLSFATNSDDGFLLSNGKTGRFALYRYNFATREIGETIFESATNDIEDFSLTDDGSQVRAVWYTDDRDRVVWFDPHMKTAQAEIDAALKDRLNSIVSRSADGNRMLIWVGSAQDPGSYYIYGADEGVMKRIARLNDKLDRTLLSPVSYTSYKARDGLDIPAYLTLPQGRAAKNLPLIIMPHGGPYGVRDKLEYNAEVQFLANRGYAVLQPNYRGSQSYGAAFYESGEGQWGRKMQDDLDDGMDWLVKDGIVDAKRVCIVGASYGGYAALWGATRNPERYRCAASFAGVSDLRRQLKYQTDFLVNRRYRKDWRATVQGQADFDLDSVSPLKLVDRLTVPVLVVHGDEDKQVPPKQSTLYAEALKKSGKDHEFHMYKGEGHGFATEANFIDWLDRLEAFLAKHNPA